MVFFFEIKPQQCKLVAALSSSAAPPYKHQAEIDGLNIAAKQGERSGLLKFLRNSQVRILFSGSLFTAAFIWMAVTAYDVDEQEIKVFLAMSFVVLGVLIAAGSLFAVVIFAVRRLRRSDDGLLAKIEAIEKETAADAKSAQDPDSKTEKSAASHSSA
jgi:hypothetical protein